MNKKNISRENYYDRLRELANVKQPIKESLSNSTLVNFVRASNTVAYAIIKENHNFYIKTSNKQGNQLSVADFAYIGGLENKKEFQYGSLSEADKNRNFILININEATNKLKTNGTKLVMLNEDISNAQSLADKNTAKDSMPKAPSNPKNISVDGLNDVGGGSSNTSSAPSSESSTEETESTEEKESTDESYNALFESGKKTALSVGGTGNTSKPDPSKDQKKADKNTATGSMPKKPAAPSNIIHDGGANKETPNPSKDQKKADKNTATGSIPKAPAKPSNAIVVEDISNAQTNANKDGEAKAQKEADKTKSTSAPEKGTEKKIADTVLKGKEEKSVFVDKPKKTVNEAEDEKDDIEAAANALGDLDAADAAGKAADAAVDATDAEADAIGAGADAEVAATDSTDDGTATTGVPAGDGPEGDFTDTTATDSAEDDKGVDAFGNGSEESEEDKERKKYIGKIQNLASSTQLTDSETVGDLKQILAGYKEAIKNLDVDQVQELIGIIKKANDGHDDSSDNTETNDEIETSNDSVETEETPFHKHMSECGYDPQNGSNISVMEMAGIINSWANKIDGSDEDGDFETVAKYYNPDVEKEVNESGNGEFGGKIKPFAEKLAEDDLQKFGSFEPKPSSLEEIFGDEEGEESAEEIAATSDNGGEGEDELEAISDTSSSEEDDDAPSFASPAILSAPTTTGNAGGSGSKTVSVDLKNQMITMNVTEAQIKAYIKKKLSGKTSIKESEEISDEKLKKEIDTLINNELKETAENNDTESFDQITENRLRKVIKFRIEERFGKRKTNIHESLKTASPLLKAIDECIDEIYKERKKK